MSNRNLESLGWVPVQSRLPKSGNVQVLITNGRYVCVSGSRILVAHPDVATHWMPITIRKARQQAGERHRLSAAEDFAEILKVTDPDDDPDDDFLA